MSKKQAIVQESDGVVENVIMADDSFDPGDGLTLVSLEGRGWVSPGDTYDSNADEFTKSETPESEPSLSDRVDALEAGTGTGDEPAKRGVSHRLDDLEDRIAALESA